MSTIEIVKKSQGRCLLKEDFIDMFYQIFLNSSKEIPPMFKHTDFVNQKKLLQHGINCIIMYYDEKKAGQYCLDRIGTSHNEEHLNIKPDLYQFWIDSLIMTIQDVDPKADATVLKAWRDVATQGVEYIKAQYRVKH